MGHFLLLASCFLLLASSCSKPSTPSATLQLQIISPHGSDIRREFAAAFSAWHQQHFGQPVEILYPDIGGGGTGNIVRYLNAAFATRGSSGDDLLFGGGSASFNSYINNNFLVPLPPLTSDEIQRTGWTTDPLDNVPPAIFNSPLHGANNLWVAATMSLFGIEVNPDRIAELHALDPRLNTPQTWADLAGPQWFGRLSLADPSKSGSVKTSYEMILQQYGWEKGWPILVQLFANASLIRDSGAAPADDVASADAVAGICIDFYGRLQTSRAGPRAAQFIVPQGGTALDSDPIALLKGAPHPQLAARFLRFVISPEGQRLWVDKPGTPGGPVQSALGRMAILPSIYQTEGDRLFDPRNPFLASDTLAYDASAAAARNPFLGDLLKAALIDNHPALLRARRAILAAGDPPDLLAQLTALPSFFPISDPPLNINHNLNMKSITYDPLQPLTPSSLDSFGAQYSPPKASPLYLFSERIQTTQKDAWRASFAVRFAQLQAPKQNP